MHKATDAAVLGDFNEVSFEQLGVVSQFYRKDGKFMVRADGPDGALRDYELS